MESSNKDNDLKVDDVSDISNKASQAEECVVRDAQDEGDLRYCCFVVTRPRWLQWLNHRYWFLVWTSCACFVQAMVVNGLIGVSMSTWETRFGLSSSEVAWIPSTYELAAIPILLFVGYFGPRMHRPRWMAGGMLLISLGSLVFAIPHFTTGLYEYSGYDEDNLCFPGSNNTLGCDGDTQESLSHYLYVFIIGAIILSFGSGPLYIVGVPAIEDTTTKDMAAWYLGIIYAMAVLGPSVAYIGGGFLLLIYTDFHLVDMDDIDIDPSDSRWVGAWWISFLVSFVLAAIVCVFIYGYPNYLPGTYEMRQEKLAKAESPEEEIVTTQPGVVGSCQDLPRVLKSLFTNHTFILSVLAAIGDAMLVVGFAVFGPKYLENQFSLSAGAGAAIFGFTAIPGGAGGTLLGGWIVQHWNMTLTQLLKWYFIFSLLCFFCVFMMLITCENPSFAGVTDFVLEEPPVMDPAIYYPCNIDCACSRVEYDPVCGENGVVYFSACYAGCLNIVDEDEGVYGNCSCVNVNSTGSVATSGVCEVEDCDLLWLFVIILLLSMLLIFGAGMFHINIDLRCVPAYQRPFALSVDWVFVRLLGAFPAPLVFGAVLDLSCVLWGMDCDGSTTSCLYYDNLDMAKYMLIVCVACKFWTATMGLIAWLTYKPTTVAVEENVISIVSQDKTHPEDVLPHTDQNVDHTEISATYAGLDNSAVIHDKELVESTNL